MTSVHSQRPSMSEEEERWLAGGASLGAARALATLKACGASGLIHVSATHTPELPPRTTHREDFTDRAHVESVTELAICCPRRFIFAPRWEKFEDVYTVFTRGRAHTVFAGMRATSEQFPEGWLPVVARAPSALLARTIVLWRALLVAPACILLVMAFFALLLVGNYLFSLRGLENTAGIINPSMCLHQYDTTDDDVVIGANGLPPWIVASLTCYANNVTVHKLPLWLSHLASLGSLVSSAGGVLKAEAIWPAAVVCSPVLAAADVPSAAIGIMSRVTKDLVLWGSLCAALFMLLFLSVIYLNRYFAAQARDLWPIVLDTHSFVDEPLTSDGSTSPSKVHLAERSSLLLLCALQQLLTVHSASIHMVSYSWAFRKGLLLARFFGATLPDCWLDVARLPFALNLSDQIVAQAQHTRTLILLIDSSYLRSTNCCKELAAAVLHRIGGGGVFLTAAILCRDEACLNIDWDAIESTLTDLGFHIAKGPRTLQEWLLARSFSVSTRREAQGMLQWFRTYGRPREVEEGTAKEPSMPTQTMLSRTNFCCSYAILLSSLCYCCFNSRSRQRGARLVAGTRMLTADGGARLSALGAGGHQACTFLALLLTLLVIMAYVVFDILVSFVDGANISKKFGGEIPIIMDSYMSLLLISNFFVLVVGLLVLLFACPALWAADPRRHYDKVLHPLVVAAQCDDWMRRVESKGSKTIMKQGATADQPKHPFFRVVLATDDASASMHGQLPSIINNLEAFLAKDIGVTVARATVREALAPTLAQASSTVTVFFLSSAQAIEEWLQHSSDLARRRHVIAVCPCCAPRDCSIMQYLFVGVCQRAVEKSAAGVSPLKSLDTRREASVPLLVLGGEEEGGSAPMVSLCTPNPTLAFDLILAISTKVPEVLMGKSGEVEE